MACALRSAIMPSSFLPLHLLTLVTRLGQVQLTLSPGVTVVATVAKGGCAGKEGVISSHPTWDLEPVSCWAGPGPSHHL